MESGTAITVIRICDNVKRIYAVKEPLSRFMIEASTAANKLAIGRFKEYYKDHTFELSKCITDGVMAYVALEKITNCASEDDFDKLVTREYTVYAVDMYGQWEDGYGIGVALDDIMNKESVLLGDSTKDVLEYAGILLYVLKCLVMRIDADRSIINEAIERRREDLKTLANLEG